MSKRSIVHVEIPTGASDESAKFYESLFGWGIQKDEKSDYTMFSSGNIGGGFLRLGDKVKVGDVTIYIASENLEADLENIVKHGGAQVGEIIVIPNFGRMGHFTDPTGNRLALWEDTSMS
jgi:predicted enzyme related to lactoylglutathione lyase